MLLNIQLLNTPFSAGKNRMNQLFKLPMTPVLGDQVGSANLGRFCRGESPVPAQGGAGGG